MSPCWILVLGKVWILDFTQLGPLQRRGVGVICWVMKGLLRKAGTALILQIMVSGQAWRLRNLVSMGGILRLDFR